MLIRVFKIYENSEVVKHFCIHIGKYFISFGNDLRNKDLDVKNPPNPELFDDRITFSIKNNFSLNATHHYWDGCNCSFQYGFLEVSYFYQTGCRGSVLHNCSPNKLLKIKGS